VEARGDDYFGPHHFLSELSERLEFTDDNRLIRQPWTHGEDGRADITRDVNVHPVATDYDDAVSCVD
jgi:hypothetical protein